MTNDHRLRHVEPGQTFVGPVDSRVVDPVYTWRHDPHLHQSHLFSISRRESEQGLGGRATGTLLSQPVPNNVKQPEGHGFHATHHGCEC